MKIYNLSKYDFIKAYLCIGFLLLSSFSLAQNTKESDYYEKELKRGDLTKKEQAKILKELATEETNPEKQLTFSLQLIVLAKEIDSSKLIFDGYLQKGNAYEQKGELTKSIESYFEASKIAIDNKLETEEAEIDLAIAAVYSAMKDYESSFEYYRKALSVLEESKDTINLLSAQLNIGDEFYKIKQIDSALIYAEKADILNAYTNNKNSEFYDYFPFFQGYIDGLKGLVNIGQDNSEEAENYLTSAIDALEEFGDYKAVSEYAGALSGLYYRDGSNGKALKFARKSLKVSKDNGFKEQTAIALNHLSKIYEDNGDYKKAYSFFRESIKYRDSVNNLADFRRQSSIQRQEAVYAEEKARIAAEEQQRLLEKQRRLQYVVIAIIGVGLIIIGFLAYKFLKQSKVLAKQKTVIEEEKQRSDDLLTNILPEETAEELKEHGSVKAKQFDNVSVLFTDFKGFTSQSELLSPEDLVKSIDHYFSYFDEIVEKYNLEKIKTIGDAYMCAGGIPFPIDHQAAKTVQAGLEMAEFVKKTKHDLNHNLAKFDIRIGIHTGPIVAGVVGTKKFQYDIWGDTVNTAARMESASDIGRVNVSESTARLLKSYEMFKLTSRGALEAKGKGKIQMFFVDYKE